MVNLIRKEASRGNGLIVGKQSKPSDGRGEVA